MERGMQHYLGVKILDLDDCALNLSLNFLRDSLSACRRLAKASEVMR